MGLNILGRIESVLEDLPKSEKKIGLFVKSNPQQVIGMTASELAKMSGSSPATVIRFCKSIDVSSYTEMKVHLSSEITSPRMIGYSDITENESIEEIKQKLLGNAYQSMIDTVEQLNHQKVEEAVETLSEAPVIYLYGVGASQLVVANILQKWSRIGKVVIFHDDFHTLLPSILTAPKGSVLWVVSNSGETVEVLNMVKVAKDNNLKTIGLTQFGTNSLTECVDIPVQTVKVKEAVIRSAATSSLHAQFMIVDIIFFAYASRRLEENSDYIKKSRDIINMISKKSK